MQKSVLKMINSSRFFLSLLESRVCRRANLWDKLYGGFPNEAIHVPFLLDVLLSTRSVLLLHTQKQAQKLQCPNCNMAAGRRAAYRSSAPSRSERDSWATGALTALMHTYTHIRRRNMLMYWLRSEYRWVRAVSYLEVFIILTILRRWVFPERFGVGVCVVLIF